MRAATAMKILEDPEGRQRPTPSPAATPAPTLSPTPTPTPVPATQNPTRHPTPFPTPEPTYVKDLPGVPCQCLTPTCFDNYDLNNDTCITQDECDLQWPLLGNCTGAATYGPAVWDPDSDGC